MSSNKSVLLLTENKESPFSQKVINAAILSSQNICIESATFKILDQVINGGIGVIVVDSAELGRPAFHFHKAVRVFHQYTPMLIATQDKLLVDQLMTYAVERDVSTERMAELLTKAIEFDDELSRANAEFSRRIDEVKHLTGDELKKAIDRIREEVFSSPTFQKKDKMQNQAESVEQTFREEPVIYH